MLKAKMTLFALTGLFGVLSGQFSWSSSPHAR
jgi:hypothetical protein